MSPDLWGMWGSTIETIWHKNLPRSLSFLLELRIICCLMGIGLVMAGGSPQGFRRYLRDGLRKFLAPAAR